MKNGVLAVVLAGLTAGCLTTRAQTPTERPALEVPPPPPRLIDPAPIPEPTPEPVPDLPPEKVSVPPPKPCRSSSKVRAPFRAAQQAAATPALPAPHTITS